MSTQQNITITPGPNAKPFNLPPARRQVDIISPGAFELDKGDLITLSYDEENRLLTVVRGTQTKTLSYDSQGRLSVVADSSTGLSRSLGYTDGLLTSITISPS